MFTSRFFAKAVTLMTILIMSLSSVQPAYAAGPSNDNFASATVISALPFDDSVNVSEATTESEEPASACAYYGAKYTVWYSFTPTTSGSISAYFPIDHFTAVLAVYRGNSLTGLTEVVCRIFGGGEEQATFHAEAGTTYYFQAGSFDGEVGDGSMQLRVGVTPPPVAQFFFSPSNPSIFDNIQFYDESYDPGQVSFQSFTWNFGDGTTATDPYPTHQYAKDGDYTVQHSLTTSDGRTASPSQVVQVRTHDVSISSILAPKSANVGQTKAITISIRNTRYPETVRIELYRSIAGGGFELISSSTQFIPVRSGNRTTQFSFNYTFSPQDAQIGKVTFRAVVQIENENDAFPGDNEAFSTPPTVVKR